MEEEIVEVSVVGVVVVHQEVAEVGLFPCEYHP